GPDRTRAGAAAGGVKRDSFAKAVSRPLGAAHACSMSRRSRWRCSLSERFAGLVCGFLNTVASSGSAVSLPILMMMGLDPIAANATNRLGVLVGAMTATGTFQRANQIPWRMALRVLPSVTLGSAVGALLAEYLPARDIGIA